MLRGLSYLEESWEAESSNKAWLSKHTLPRLGFFLEVSCSPGATEQPEPPCASPPGPHHPGQRGSRISARQIAALQVIFPQTLLKKSLFGLTSLSHYQAWGLTPPKSPAKHPDLKPPRASSSQQDPRAPLQKQQQHGAISWFPMEK